MRIISHFFSLQCFVASLASFSALTTAYAAPLRSDYTALDRRAETTLVVDGKVAELGTLISPASHTKSKVWRLAKWDGKSNPGYVLKKYNGNVPIGREVIGLNQVGQLIASDPKAKVLVMTEVKGKTFARMVADVPHDKRRDFLNEWRTKVAAALAAVAKSKRIYHDDNNMNNIIVAGSNIHFIDWEHFMLSGEDGFLDDVDRIKNKLFVWDSSGTPQDIGKSNSSGASGKKSNSPGASGKKSASPRPSPGGSVKKSGSPKRKSPRRREVFYD
jgi:hypothetical protein